MAPQLAWLGLGNMGRGMCKNLIEKGSLANPLIIYNRTTSRAETLSSQLGHSTVAKTIPEATKSADVIFLCLGDDESVLTTINEILKSDKEALKGKILVDCSTVHPDTTAEETKLLEDAGVEFVACPVFGAPAMADAGQLVCVLAGKKAALEKVTPYCQGVMGRANIEYPDHPPRDATLLKVIGNTFVMGMIESLSEGHVLAEKSGLGVKELHKIIEIMFPGPYTAYSNRMMSGDYYKREEPLFAVDLARKDIRHAQQLANGSGMKMKHLELADGWLKVVKEEMGAKGDIAAIYGAKRAEAGLPFKNDG